MSSDAEKRLLSSILNQVNFGHINWDKVAKDVNVSTKSAAQMRWTRFKKTLSTCNQESNGNGTASPAATPKKRQSPKKSKAPKGSPKKKQKRTKSGIYSDDEDEEVQLENDDKEENKKITPETPARSLPSRKAKTRSPIKEALTSDEEEDEINVEVKDREQIENGETQGTEFTEETMANVVDSGSDFDGDVEEA
ncbi:7e58eef2-46b2-4b86-aabd-e4b87d07f387 [Sclerotinia trifoliorum]|uniref:7e58eef2-46b2-4b86-aabd-e4b87d07f387 n=1 Tax=Sclerotinia trifoliorum TaxID=28548 RepID=A0A8H2VMF2_9HELO|nr:7e58eef2-46b2-4b86-aabd-e4b87d07f387 [Sclerotinia trifoliorum]